MERSNPTGNDRNAAARSVTLGGLGKRKPWEFHVVGAKKTCGRCRTQLNAGTGKVGGTTEIEEVVDEEMTAQEKEMDDDRGDKY